MNSTEEQALVGKAKRGDKDALGKLWDSATPKLFGYLVNVTHDQELAEDMLQTTWLHALKALPKFQQQNRGGFSAWLFAIARNECKQHWRKTKQETAFANGEYEKTNITRESSDHADTENTLLVEQVLNSLSEDDKELLRLRYIADLPVADIGKILNINFVAVRVRLHRAITRARLALNTNHENL
jgi:RNA polymerase sigma-70 factor, ECF subfamily